MGGAGVRTKSNGCFPDHEAQLTERCMTNILKVVGSFSVVVRQYILSFPGVNIQSD